MGQVKKTTRQALYGSQKHLTLKSRLYVLLRDELGLGRQPKIAQLLCDEIAQVVNESFVSEDQMKIGQVLVLAPELGQGNTFKNGLDQIRLRTVRLTLLTMEDIEALTKGLSHDEVRMMRIARMVREAYSQGAALSTTQLGLLMGIHPSRVSDRIRHYHQTHEDLLPIRGIVEDCSSATTHKAQICKLHLEGLTTSEIAAKTNHSENSVERYIRRFNQIREIVRYLDKAPDSVVIARILRMGHKLAQAYLDLIPQDEIPGELAAKERDQ